MLHYKRNIRTLSNNNLLMKLFNLTHTYIVSDLMTIKSMLMFTKTQLPKLIYMRTT